VYVRSEDPVISTTVLNSLRQSAVKLFLNWDFPLVSVSDMGRTISLCYMPEGCGLETRKGFFLIYLLLPVSLCPGVHSVSNKNVYQKQKINIF
jgi:hypothetical protein